MAVARRDPRDAVAVVEQREPVLVQQLDVGLECGGSYDFERVEAQQASVAGYRRKAEMLAGEGIEVPRAERNEIGVQVARMIERDHLHTRRRADGSGRENCRRARPSINPLSRSTSTPPSWPPPELPLPTTGNWTG